MTKEIRWALLGATRGFGKAFLETLPQSSALTLVSSRSKERLDRLDSKIQTLLLDASSSKDYPVFFERLEAFAPHRIVCFIGGGPFGSYDKKKWTDHQWALQISFLFQAELIHRALKIPKVEQIVVIGSAIAEHQPDPGAASYSAAKHGLKGLVSSIQAENIEKDVRLYSPGYMDTEMLPKNAPPRATGKIAEPVVVAADLYKWLMDPMGRNSHRVFAP